ncbi:MAG: GNAT family N-acetyltransferase [Omnitrophica WOR_2 bacterium]
MNIDSAFTHFPTLTTSRLTLRQVRLSDADALFAIKSDPRVTSEYAQEPHQSLDDTRGWIQRLIKSYDQRDGLFWCLTLKGESNVIGGCPYWNFGPGFHSAEIGYELHPAYYRQGLMSEAITAILTYGFNELGLHRVEANPLARNTASKNLLLKLGFKYEGNLRQRIFFRGVYEDQLYYGLLKEEWLNKNIYP